MSLRHGGAKLNAAGALAAIGPLLAPSLVFGDETTVWSRVLLLHDYNTRVVLIGSTVLGVCLGVVGLFMLLRRRSLMGDVVSHASLPGIAMGFLLMEAVSPGDGKWVPGLLVGALISAGTGMLCVVALRRLTRLKEDAALAIVLSAFFGFGIVLLSIIQAIPSGNAAGLHHFIYGKAASMVAADVWLIVGASVGSLLLVGAVFKELRLLCFDEVFARSQGWPTLGLDLLIMGVVVGMSVVGLQSVGLLLVVAMLIIPASSGRFWSDKLFQVVIASGVIGGASAFCGVLVSALAPNIATGAVIVLSSSAFFAASLLFGAKRGLLLRSLTFRSLQSHVGDQNLLRAIYEHCESHSTTKGKVDLAAPFRSCELLPSRAWQAKQIEQLLRRAGRNGWCRAKGETWALTELGAAESRRTVRNHRLWELYLIEYAEVAPTQVDRNADDIEHVLGGDLVAELEALLSRDAAGDSVPDSPHEIVNPVHG